MTGNTTTHDQNGLQTLDWIVGRTGTRLLAYLLGIDEADLPALISGTRPPSSRQFIAIELMSAFRVDSSRLVDDKMTATLLQTWLSQISETGRTIAAGLRVAVTDEPNLPELEDNLESLIRDLAIDIYPLYLLPPDPSLATAWRFAPRANPHASGVSFRHPKTKAFCDAALEVPPFKDLFELVNESIGYAATTFRNTGSGSTLQLAMMPGTVLDGAWTRLPEGSESLDDFIEAAIADFRLARDLLRGKTRSTKAILAFTGVMLPDGSQLNFSDSIVRATTDADRQFAPDSLKSQLTGTDADGKTTVINYDGDVILEWKYPFRMRAERGVVDFPSQWPQEMLPPEKLEQDVKRLRFSLMLAVVRDSRVQLVPTWRHIEEPLSSGRSMSWNDPRQGVSIMPTELTMDEFESWRDWYDRLNTRYVDKIELAITRILRAIAERREPSDVLIDSVIAWENLFGTSEGEPTFRVTMCLAKLLEDTHEKRKELRTKLSAIYGLRSKVVHGSRNLKADEYSKCQDALDVAIAAVRTLTTDRTDILELPDGAARSAALLLGH